MDPNFLLRVCICGRESTLKCGGCRLQSYCSVSCQLMHRQVHKEFCSVAKKIKGDIDLLKEQDLPGKAESLALINSKEHSLKWVEKLTSWCEKYTFFIPNIKILKKIKDYSNGRLIVDIYGRNGYWTMLFKLVGLNSICADVNPNEFNRNFSHVLKMRSDEFCKKYDLSNAIIFYGYPDYVDDGDDPEHKGYFPEMLLNWKGNTIMTTIDLSNHPYFKIRGKIVPTTADVLKAARKLTGFNYECVYTAEATEKFDISEKGQFQIYEKK